MSEIDPGSVDGIPVFETGELAEIYNDEARREILGDDSWEPVPEIERTPAHEVPHIVASEDNWTQYSDGETLYYEGDIPFYLE